MKTTPYLTVLLVASLTSSAFAQGPLPPPPDSSLPFADRALDSSGAPVPSMKTLTQTDPGQPIPSRDADLPGLTGSTGAYTIAKPGHYYLTENLTLPVIIESDDVTLDLRGFLIEFQPTAAAGPGTRIAIDGGTGAGAHHNITVRNGHIKGQWLMGVRLGTGSYVHQLQVSGTTTYNIWCGKGSRVETCTVRAKAAEQQPGGPPTPPGFWSGIYCEDNCIIRGCLADNILAIGIQGLQNSRITDCVSTNNSGCGIVANSSSALSGCAASNNGATGIDVNTQVSLLNCTATGNFNEGFHIRGGCALTNCTARENKEEGFFAERMTFAGNQNPPENNMAVNFLQCVAQKNAWDGFHTDMDCTFTHCTADNNGSPPPQPGQTPPPVSGTSHGFHVTDGCQFVNCLAVANLASGYRAGSQNRIENCSARNNGSFGVEVATDQNLVIRNSIRLNGAGQINLPPNNGIAAIVTDPDGPASANSNFAY